MTVSRSPSRPALGPVLGSVAVAVSVEGVQRQRRVGVGPSGTHLGGDPDRFHDLLVGGSGLRRQAGVSLDAGRALGYVRDRYGDELLRARIERAVFEHGLAVGLE